MKKFKHKIEAENGLHARPAGALSNLAKSFKSDIKIKAQEKSADAKRLLSVMSLGAGCGTELHFIIEGEDEDTAYKELLEFCNNTLGGGK